MSDDRNEIDFDASMLRIALENNALLKTILHYQEKAEAQRLGVTIDAIEAQTDELLNQNMQQAMELLSTQDDE